MVQYTSLDRSDINSILSEYPIKIEDLSSFEVLSGGSENTNYLLKCEKRNHVLSISEQKSTSDVESLAALLEHLEIYNFKSSKLIKTLDNRPYAVWNDKPVMIKDFVEGKVMAPLTPSLIRLVGAEIGKLHNVPMIDSLPKQIAYGVEQFTKVKNYDPGSDFDVWLDEIHSYIIAGLNTGLPRAVTHNDIFDNNVVVANDESSATILDFEEAAYYFRVFDLGMAIIGTCTENQKINLGKVSCLMEGYKEHIDLSEDEFKYLQAFTVYAGAAMTFWRYLNFNYVNPTAGMENHFEGLRLVTDYIQNLRGDGFLEAVR